LQQARSQSLPYEQAPPAPAVEGAPPEPPLDEDEELEEVVGTGGLSVASLLQANVRDQAIPAAAAAVPSSLRIPGPHHRRRHL
jgi:hypothetical protein